MLTPRLTALVRPYSRPRALDRWSRRLLALLVVACSLPAATARAQDDNSADPLRATEYRAQKESATEIFLDSAQPKEARLEAAKNLGYPEAETFAAMLRIGADAETDDEIRWQALQQHRFDDNLLGVVLNILEDPEDGGGELVGDLIENLSRRTTFQLAAPLEQRIRAALRDLLDDPRERVRVAAYRSLVGGHDTVAVNRLVEALNAGDVPIPLDEAISLLDLDGSIYHIRTLRPYLDHADPSVRAQAARALAVDPGSRPQIVELAVDPAAPEEVRLHALRALAREDDAFVDYALALLADPDQPLTIRHAAMKMLAGRLNYRQVEESQQIRFAEMVESLARGSALETKSGEELRQEAEKLLAYLLQAFPAIERHYAFR